MLFSLAPSGGNNSILPSTVLVEKVGRMYANRLGKMGARRQHLAKPLLPQEK